jgi:hypothetical protein
MTTTAPVSHETWCDEDIDAPPEPASHCSGTGQFGDDGTELVFAQQNRARRDPAFAATAHLRSLRDDDHNLRTR